MRWIASCIGGGAQVGDSVLGTTPAISRKRLLRRKRGVKKSGITRKSRKQTRGGCSGKEEKENGTKHGSRRTTPPGHKKKSRQPQNPSRAGRRVTGAEKRAAEGGVRRNGIVADSKTERRGGEKHRKNAQGRLQIRKRGQTPFQQCQDKAKKNNHAER